MVGYKNGLYQLLKMRSQLQIKEYLAKMFPPPGCCRCVAWAGPWDAWRV